MIKKVFVPSQKLAYLYSHIDKINRKAMKIGVSGIEVISKNERKIVNPNNKAIIDIAYDIELKYEVVKIGQYDIIAYLTHTYDGGNIVVKISDNIELPEEYYNIDGFCEHCNINHKRKYTYVISDEYGKYKQIGKTCMKDYTGYDISNIFSIVESMESIEELLNNYNQGISGGDMFNRDLILNITKELVERYGYTSKGVAYDNGSISTVERVLDVIYENYTKVDNIGKEIYKDIKDKCYDMELDSEMISALEWIDSKNVSGNEYLNNLKILSNSEEISKKHLGYVVSLLLAYRRDTKVVEKEEKQEKVISKHVGDIKEKVESYLTLEKVIFVDTMYSTSGIHIFSDDSKNILKWFTTTQIDMEIGQRAYLKYTIKSHDEYLGESQTSITRVKMI